MKPQKNQVRIIAGKWRGRKINFPDVGGLRPTTDRIRETVFNWLMPHLGGAMCLDLFAGSGALGFEAASRGARQVDMVETSRPVFDALTVNQGLFDATNVRLYFQDALSYLKNTKQTYNILFLDPPFGSELLEEICQVLSEKQLIRSGGHIYLEQSVDRRIDDLSSQWEILKEKRAGNVRYMLARFQSDKG